MNSDLTNPSDSGKFTDEQLQSIKYVASIIGKLGGMSRSDAKAKASKENGKLGGRPKKKRAEGL